MPKCTPADREGTIDPEWHDLLEATVQGDEQATSLLDSARTADPATRSELAALAASSGRLAVTAGDHETAERLLNVAIELSDATGVERARLLLDLARASESRGDITRSRELLNDVVSLAEAGDDVDLLVDAAVRSTFPPDWRAGDRRTAAMLDLAERLDAERTVGASRRGAILAARSMVEMRIPISADPQQQVAWVTRASVAQPLAEEALTLTEGRSDADRLVALVAWRSTHRGPTWLLRRLEVSAQAVDLAQRLLDHDRLADASVGMAVDSLEAGDRAGHARAVATLRWAASSDGNPRLRWWAATVAAGAALLDGDTDTATRHRAEADAVGDRHALPGWVAAELLLAAEITITTDDATEMRKYLGPDDFPVLESPIARASVALMSAILGDVERAGRYATLAVRALDQESSYLLCLALLGRTAATIGDAELGGVLLERLAPWRGRVAVDASGWWCIGPVDLAIAELEVVAGRGADAATSLDAAEELARSIGDVRSLQRVDEVRARLGRPADGARPSPAPETSAGIDELSDRELDVLRLIARGRTNAAIGAELSYSPSTIRADTVSIYRKLGVRGRAEAAAVAVTAGLLDPTT
ncbi:LuxR C-terminal-related transcriptional regulator [Dermatobacter hominis]|uniref:LuxR C-terminal-related transcriptional regulator n=1 Tax=Dermatobacter hominis TaxID=2884263 RepID=UPI001D0F89EF|nr:LuxR C-terminal-related transcriptional regulator [Dermatobacter hominis]UDY37425.1 LuxR C-terminal-related transcriptional regulator [Dermatobacter hominis]